MNKPGQSEMKVSFALSDIEIEEVIHFTKKIKFPSDFNHPHWAALVEPYKKPIYFRFYEKSILNGFAIVYIRMSYCIMHFGPMVFDQEKLIEYLRQIALHLKGEKFGLFAVQLYPNDMILFKSKYFKYPEFKKRISFNRIGWSTIQIPLVGKTHEDVFKQFSKGHKSAIKKTYREGLEVKFEITKNELKKLSEIYNDMHHRKGLVLPLPDALSAFNKIIDLNLGVFAGVFLKNEIIGAVLFVSEGNTFVYRFGATDFKYHKLPVLHLVIYEMIKYAINLKYEYFDLGGYDPIAERGGYSDGINVFKKGFGGDIVKISEPFSIRLNFMKALFVNAVMRLKRLFPDSIMKVIYSMGR